MRAEFIPHDIGIQETGCHTHVANDIVLFIENTQTLVEKKRQIFEMCFKRFSRYTTKQRQGWFTRSVTTWKEEEIFPKAGIPKTHEYCFTKSGVLTLNAVGGYLDSAMKSFFSQIKSNYERETGIALNPNEIEMCDLRYWMIREFQDWLNENKRY